MFISDFHNHTVASKHAFNTVQELASDAEKKGIKYLGITDHGPAAIPDGGTIGYFLCGKRLPEMISNVRILFGIESNVINIDGDLDLENSILEKLNIVIAGLHPINSCKDLGEENNTKALINSIKNPLVHMISHPYSSYFKVDLKRVTKAAIEHDKLIEINNSYITRMGNKIDYEIIKKLKIIIDLYKQNNKKLIITSDSHTTADLGNYDKLISLFPELGLSKEDIINNDIPALRKHFNF